MTPCSPPEELRFTIKLHSNKKGNALFRNLLQKTLVKCSPSYTSPELALPSLCQTKAFLLGAACFYVPK